MPELRFPLVCFDLDGTLVDDTIYIWKTLHDILKTDQVARKCASEDYFAGRLTYREWFEHDLALFDQAGATRSRILEIIDRLRPMSGARELLAELKEKGHILAVISGSLDIVVDRLFGRDLFDHLLINRIDFNEQGRISGGEHTPFDLEGKADGLIELARREKLSLSQTIFIGDNDNDYWIARAAGRAIAFNCKSDRLRSVCEVEITGKELGLVLPYIG